MSHHAWEKPAQSRNAIFQKYEEKPKVFPKPPGRSVGRSGTDPDGGGGRKTKKGAARAEAPAAPKRLAAFLSDQIINGRAG